jgi:hypothetical protein
MFGFCTLSKPFRPNSCTIKFNYAALQEETGERKGDGDNLERGRRIIVENNM